MPSNNLTKLIELVEQLCDEETGCPWLREQTFTTLASLTIEESYELADSILNKNPNEIRDELSDLLLHLILYAKLARDQKQFGLEDIAQTAIDKQLRRKIKITDTKHISAEEALAAWEASKQKEREEKSHKRESTQSILDDVPSGLPSLLQATKLQQTVAKVGFDWQTLEPIFAKLTEETDELKQALNKDETKKRLTEELGDILFTTVNLARKLNIDPEIALRTSSQKFTTRFQQLEKILKEQGKNISETSLDEMDAIWDELKKR